MPPELGPSVHETLSDFEQSNIILVEWETPLLRRLGYPLAPKPDLVFLVPDEQLQVANDIAKARGLLNDNHPPSYLSELAGQGFRYVYGNPKRLLMLAPLSWTGIKKEELMAVAPSARQPSYTTWTVPLPVFCVAYLRIIMQESAGSRVRVMAIADLSSVIAYSMFDMGYEGDCMLGPEDVIDEGIEIQRHVEEDMAANKDALDMQNALNSIREWHFTEDAEWARGTLIQLVSGTLRYEDLPSNGRQGVMDEDE
ncbi:uncharacterized protein NECHADRAFT_88832 [Fusarium vanettenii 77-13-4]|uniref:Uncharacterized protein n=1 Tax=Fusarium vanettenii (strain ATCC MYA-4622 / CBS 123669 / FGSC 9596 / NRRL 45880 / 77-13-4) TaxID=660122 RepID=C7ZN74_FUSV7|nr:uncharacterized protein NECHADRAFT_88832 [Fusarium vanettenii 77-13-4]EEU34537.1 predicted protein [Fusarium vanettenii 77-13-4]